jgi:hypothetical protein
MYWVQQGLDAAQALGNRVETANGLNNIGSSTAASGIRTWHSTTFTRALAIREGSACPRTSRGR